MSDLTLYTHPHSRGVSISWMLEECQANYQVNLLQFHTSMKAPEYLALNPAGKVPTLTDGTVVISETAAILTYLADQYPERQLAPAVTSPQRGEYYKWLFFFCNQLEPALTNKKHAIIDLTDKMHFELGYASLDVIIQQYRQHLSQNRYLLGEQFTAADIQLTGLLVWANTFQDIIQLDQTLTDYVASNTQREAFVRAMQLNQDYTAKMQD